MWTKVLTSTQFYSSFGISVNNLKCYTWSVKRCNLNICIVPLLFSVLWPTKDNSVILDDDTLFLVKKKLRSTYIYIHTYMSDRYVLIFLKHFEYYPHLVLLCIPKVFCLFSRAHSWFTVKTSEFTTKICLHVRS